MKLLVRGIDILFLARPLILVPVWAYAVFGCRCGFRQAGISRLPIMSCKEQAAVFGGIALFSLSVGAVYVLNQIADYAVDRRNEGFPLLVRSGIGRKTALWFAVILGVSSMAVPFFCGYRVVSLFSAAALGLGTLYSFKPAYFSGRPFLDFFANAFGFGIIAFGAGWFFSPAGTDVTPAFFRAAAPYFLLMCGGSIGSTLPDMPGDSAGGKLTTAVFMGTTHAHRLATVLVFTGGIVAMVNKDVLAGVVAIHALVIDIIYIIRPTKALMEAAYKISGGIAMVAAGVVFPLFVPAAAAVFAATWLYFRLRHHVLYPSLIPVSVSHASNQR